MDSDLVKLFSTINKNYDKSLKHQTIRMLTKENMPEIKTFPSGSLNLDLAIGRGGLPRGRIIEVFGPESSGKTTVCLLHIAEVQKANEGLCAFVDAEHAFDPMLAHDYGVDLDNLAYVDALTAEQSLDTVEALVRTGKFRLVVVDSVSALTPTVIAESSIEKQTMGLQARLMSTAMMKLNGVAYQNDCSVIFINQLREKVGAFSPIPGQAATTTSGGRALPFYSSVRLRVTRVENIGEKENVIGHVMKVKVVKNKIGVPFKEATFPIYYNVGVDKVYEIVTIAILAGIIYKSSGWYSYRDGNNEIIIRDGEKYQWNGESSVIDFVRSHETFMNELESRVRGVEVEAPTGAPESEDGYSIEEAAAAAVAAGLETPNE
jgi:recombination protein RecA